ncbi:glutamyl-tRNA reductase [Brumimicrobium salinarum]|uniref:Glutamyl-tRNA reductase n=1 Tax=Brumimicrobium salinarum TaxID=2058658 RepID=A0A2I0R6N9_9FLAO|nr:glutamyl-tRNA reductase [Brumimicrobium salinarum]PKR82252.1 glutamyl-tRNA reductase [Brumimicrobium salinarum]
MTIKTGIIPIFVSEKREKTVEDIHIFAFTHRQLDVNQIGLMHIAIDDQKEKLSAFKDHFEIQELMYVSTCNRVEFILKKEGEISTSVFQSFLSFLFSTFKQKELDLFSSQVEHYHGYEAIEHLIKVSSSIDSMVVGEREIITQIRKSYDICKGFNLTGDSIRLMIRHTIETAKKIYTQTNIAQNPVSVVSLAYHTLRTKDIPLDARILIIGAGVTNTNMSRFLKKHGYTNFAVFNRTESKAETLAKLLGGSSYPLSQLPLYQKGFDIVITCTGADTSIIDAQLYESLLQGDTDPKVVIDLAIPSDLDPKVATHYPMDYISIEYLQKISSKNLEKRAREIIHVEEIVKEAVVAYKSMVRERKVEIAMRVVPETVKEIKATAVQHVFAKEIENLDTDAQETMEKIIAYFEKKYMSVPMKMAKEILLKK